ncbi:MAG: hypothetical protein H6900_14090 [Rhodobacter sp.]|uniref:hypothetical protein n=1 Tax=Pararhodobacter sp. TaxID=2127056 RepID=UPI001E083CEA|nr:hypothetical protein [Pararhodobacter sp.]MCB1345773.1 hypothetical protein [Paracoccaceae bacterium]MCC0074411.1 hypothetical protein [Rhodobacter sp.]HPD91391.1 hypothetical protein [Pararhodobacter sp.]
MSDAMTNREIEDVLTSIRRLVAQEGTRGAEAGRLILTEAQRVATDSAAPESEIPAATAAPADSPNGAPRSDARRLRAEGDLTLPEPDFGKLEATIAELEAAVSASGEAWEGEAVEEAPRVSNVTELYGRLNFNHRSRKAQPGAPATGAMAPETDAARDRGEGPQDATPDDAAEGPSPVAATEVGLSLADTGNAESGGDVTPDGTPDDVTPDVVPVVASVAPSEGEAERADEAVAPDEGGEADAVLETVIDEAALRALVAQIVREELHGQLGERITLQVRKLVRAEIAKALDERALL